MLLYAVIDLLFSDEIIIRHKAGDYSCPPLLQTFPSHIQERILAKNYYSFDKRKKELAKKKKKEEKRLRKLEHKKGAQEGDAGEQREGESGSLPEESSC
jgi:hypothetical protein